MKIHETVLLCVIAVLALAGNVLSVYLTAIFIRVQRGRAVQCVDGSCPIVMKTPYAQTFGFPNWYLAVPFYVGLLVFALLRLAGLAEWLLVPVATASALSVAMSAHLAFVLLVKLKQP